MTKPHKSGKAKKGRTLSDILKRASVSPQTAAGKKPRKIKRTK
ncbi:MAG: hypothetical protein ABFQ95_01090 [Pseudomonadota bacterium]